MTLSVLTLNLWNDAGPYERRAERIRAWIERLDPDVIGFQEVLRGENADQAAELLAGRGYHLEFGAGSRFFREGSRFSPAEFGNAVASRWPIVKAEVRELPNSGDGETRAATSVTLDTPFGPVGFTCAHLNWKFSDSATRERQVLALCDLALERRPTSGFPPILVGDFNAEPESSEIRYVTGLQPLEGRSMAMLDAWRMAGDGGPGFTWSNHNPYAATAFEPDRRIDYIFAGWPVRNGVGQIVNCRVVCDDESDGVWPTDHFGVWAELRTEPIPGFEEEWGLAGGDDASNSVRRQTSDPL